MFFHIASSSFAKPPQQFGLQSIVHNTDRSYAKSSLLLRTTYFIPINPMEAITIIIRIPKKISHDFL